VTFLSSLPEGPDELPELVRLFAPTPSRPELPEISDSSGENTWIPREREGSGLAHPHGIASSHAMAIADK
jgi:hypothetical protein